MTSAIEISSNALLLIGDEPISSFEDIGAGAKAAANLYPSTKEAVLGYHPWSFALREVELSLLSEAPDKRTGYKYAYVIPTDLIRLWAVFPYSDYVIVGPHLYSNDLGLLARYVYDVPEANMPAPMVKSLEYQLASEFAVSITEDTNKADYYAKKAQMALAKASNIDSQGAPQIAVKSSPFVAARYRGSDASFGNRGF